MAVRISGVLVALALLLGLGNAIGLSGEKPDDKAAGKGASDTIPFPEKVLKEVKDALASDSKLTDQNVDSYIKYMKSLVELQKGAAADPMAMVAKIQNLPKDCGFKDEEDMALRMKQIASGMQLVMVMAIAEAALNAADVSGLARAEAKAAYTKALADVRRVAGEAGLSEADLRLVHRRLKDLEAVGGDDAAE
jgi:hypothetical protein